jgi:hypothetical protein
MRLTPPRRCLKARDATQAEYDRFGGVGIALARPSESPAMLLLPKYLLQGLLLRANDLLLATTREQTSRGESRTAGFAATVRRASGWDLGQGLDKRWPVTRS